MTDQFILTPFFLDQPLLELEGILDADWILNRPEVKGSDPFERMNSIHKALVDLVNTVLDAGDRPVSVAGDCCTSIAVLAALQQRDIYPHLLWLDAHGDFNTHETSPSGFIGGMPLAMLVGRGDQRLLVGVGAVPLAESQSTLCDGRDLDALEEQALFDSEVSLVPSIQELADAPPKDTPLWVHFDTDIVTSAEMPAHNYPAPEGPTSAQVEDTFLSLAETRRVVAVSVSTWNPRLEGANKSQQIAMRLLKTLLGKAGK